MLFKKQIVHIPQMQIAGLSTRTNNQAEMDPTTGKIGPTIESFHQNQIANSLKKRLQPDVFYSVYTDYESDENGDYTYYFGEKVEPNSEQGKQCTTLLILEGRYQKFTTRRGAMPDIVIEAWQEIWQMKEADLGAKRSYSADFEVYDERSQQQDAEVDIYIALQS